jgi:hypothetical protein
MSDELNIFLGIASMILLANSFYIHFIVKDGLARKMLLWVNGLLFAMLFFRTLGYVLFCFDKLDIYQSRTWNQFVFSFIYLIVLGQQWIQRGHAQRDEAKIADDDSKELKKRRKKNKLF